MKLHRIEVQNLNSLYGTQVLDLDTQLADAPMFLIHGRTGAGKSTLLDAVCLALFGQTPRLARGRGDEDQDPSQIMSRGTTECLSTVEFSLKLQEGRVRYRATWSCWRAKKSLKVQDPVRRLERLDTDGRGGQAWTVLTDSKLEKDYKPHFDHALLGLTVEDFKRSILLAQGEFAAFLRASESERSAMLERLTDTGQYAAIGRRAGDVTRQKRAEHERLKLMVGQVQVLSEDEAEAVSAELGAIAAEVKQLSAEITAVDAGIRWAEERDRRVAALGAATAQRETVRARREAARPDLERLAEDSRCQGAGATLGTALRLEGELQPLVEKLASLAGAIGLEEQRVTEATEALTAADAGLAEASAALAQAAPMIQEARALRLSANAAIREAEGAEAERARSQAVKLQHQAALDAARARQESAVEALNQAIAARTRLADAEALAERAPVWLAAVEQLQGQGVELRRREKAVLALEEAQARAAESLERAALALAPAFAAVMPLEAEVDASKARLSALIGDAPDPRTARKALDLRRAEAVEAGARLDRLMTPIERLSRAADALTALQNEAAEARAEREALTSRLPTLEALEGAQRARREAAEETVRARALVLDLASRRHALRDGEPCPLCGGLEHPWAGLALDQAATDAAEAAKQALEQASQALHEAGQQRSALKAQVDQIDANQMRLGSRVSAATRDLQAAARALDEALALAALQLRVDDLELSGVAAALMTAAEQISARRLEVQTELTEVQQALSALDEADAANQGATSRLSAAREALASHERAHLSAQGESARATDAARREIQARDELKQGFDEARGALHEALRAAGLHPAEGELRSAVAEAAARVTAWKTALQAENSGREALSAVEIARASAESAAIASARAADEACARATERRGLADSAVERAKQALQGQDPDAVERRLSQAQTAASAARQAASTSLEARRQARAALEGQVLASERQRQELHAQLTQAQDALSAALRALDLPDREALSARILPSNQREAHRAMAEALQRAETEAHTRHQDAEAALSAHAAEQPEHAPDTAEALTHARARQTELGARRAEALQKQGALQQKLAQHAQNLMRLGAMRAELAAAAEELSVWERIYALIGVGNGDAFKKYAQILNLEDLLQRANERLQWLAPRYRLAPAKGPNGEERLAFAVKDEHHALEPRPLTTLSGGETFLVSLALALALAEYRTLQAPIETLLLDEGFGTLDTDTLNTVMDALEKLQARGARVGLISHVDGLRERVEARVAVEAVGHGRSRIRVELGAGAALRVA